jgi:radical SAM protein with 4Fe4S-binding SPASM domain
MFEGIKKARGLRPDHPFCFAADMSMYFHFDGNVAACCYQREHYFGRYPEKSISEIWESASRSKLSEKLRADDLSSGCSRCFDQALAGNTEGLLASHFDANGLKHAVQDGPAMPRMMEFVLGTTCNLECIMCGGECSSSIRKNREKLPPRESPYDLEFVRQLRPYIPGLVDVRFLGGEPFLNDLNFEVWELLLELNPSALVFITTNGSVLTDRAKDVLQTLKPELAVSVDSLVPENYEGIRLNARFPRLRKNLEWLIERGLVKCLTACPMRMNWQDMPGIVDFCNQHGLQVYFNTVYDPPSLSLRYAPPELLDQALLRLSLSDIGEARPLAGPKALENRKINRSRYGDLIRQLSGWRNLSKTEARLSAGQQSMLADTDFR